MKSEKSTESQNSKKLFIKSIHNLFSDPKWRPNDEELNDELLKHPFLKFQDILNLQKNNSNIVENI